MDAQVGESSACATALLCGVKANYETVGLDSSAHFEDCYSSFEARVPSLINWAQDQGKFSRVNINLQKKTATIKMIIIQVLCVELMCACVRACVCACVRACVCVCV